VVVMSNFDLQLVLDIDRLDERRKCWAHNGDVYGGPTLNRWEGIHNGDPYTFWMVSCDRRGYDDRGAFHSVVEQMETDIERLQELVRFIKDKEAEDKRDE
jgi:hypothetical protein